MAIDRARIARDLDELAPTLRGIAARIHGAPETSFAENAAADLLAGAAREAQAEVERPLAGLSTAFRAVSGSGGGRVAILAEYDALPGLGHGCGHDLIAAGALGGFLALARQSGSLAGRIELIGSPAEETGGGKVKLGEAGVFDGLDAAMMFHPGDRDLLAQPALASAYVELAFEGRTAHPSIAPWLGRSAVTACLDAMRLVDGQRIHLPPGASVHGRVLAGGDWTSVIGDRAACAFAVRARDPAELEAARALVERCGRGAAIAGDVKVEATVKPGYRALVTNGPLAARFGDHLRALGRRPELRDEGLGCGSTDMGDVSARVPSIHPWIAICPKGAGNVHSREFAELATTREAADAMLDAAKALALTAADVLEDAALGNEIRRTFSGARVGG